MFIYSKKMLDYLHAYQASSIIFREYIQRIHWGGDKFTCILLKMLREIIHTCSSSGNMLGTDVAKKCTQNSKFCFWVGGL